MHCPNCPLPGPKAVFRCSIRSGLDPGCLCGCQCHVSVSAPRRCPGVPKMTAEQMARRVAWMKRRNARNAAGRLQRGNANAIAFATDAAYSE